MILLPKKSFDRHDLHLFRRCETSLEGHLGWGLSPFETIDNFDKLRIDLRYIASLVDFGHTSSNQYGWTPFDDLFRTRVPPPYSTCSWVAISLERKRKSSIMRVMMASISLFDCNMLYLRGVLRTSNTTNSSWILVIRNVWWNID